MRRINQTGFVAAVALALILAACSAQPGDTPGAISSGGAASAPAPSSGGEFADTIVTALDAQVGAISNATNDVPTARIQALVYDTLYQLDDTLTPIPMLTDGLCDVSADELVWTCPLIDGVTFHNGDPVTVDDVVYTYQLAISPNCTFNPSVCLAPFLEGVEAVDDSTVQFTLVDPYAPFATSVLPAIVIESQAVIEAAYADFSGGTEGIDPDEVAEAIEAIGAATEADSPESEACLGAAGLGTAVLEAAGVEFAAQEDFVVEDDPGTEEDETNDGACAWAASLTDSLTAVQQQLESEGIDAVAAVYELLGFNSDPVGSGPYELESCTTEGCVLTAYPDYWQGTPATPTIEMPIYTDVAVAANALAAGEIDWVEGLTPDARSAVAGAVADGAVQLAEYNQFAHAELQYNMHESIPLADGSTWQGWFYDVNLRQAMRYCIDKPTLVEIATDGNGVPIEADIPPASWAFNTDLQPVERDIEQARSFIESATVHTWTEGDDGIYVNENGEPLSALVLVRAGQADRVDFMNLLAEQVRECGIDIQVEAADFQTVLIPSLSWPHIPPGQDEPWHAYFGAWGVGVDPDPYALFHSSQCTSEDQPGTFNYVCLQDAEIDRLIDEGLRTSDQAERTEIYHAYQERLQELQPYLFAWSDVAADGLAAGMRYSDGPLELDSPNWGWQRHKLVKVVGD